MRLADWRVGLLLAIWALGTGPGRSRLAAQDSQTPGDSAQAKEKKKRLIEAMGVCFSLQKKLAETRDPELTQGLREKLMKAAREVEDLAKELAGEDPSKLNAYMDALVKEHFPKEYHARQAARARIQLKSFRIALEQYRFDTDRYPTEEEGLKALIAKPGTSGKGPYLDYPEIPKDPWGHSYLYRFPGKKNPSEFELRSVGPDGVEGTPDDIEG